MTSRYEQSIQLTQRLEQNSRLIPAKDLYALNQDELYAAMMEQLARPLPNGESSPFTSKSPTTAHAIFMGAVAYYQALLAHEFNQIPDRGWVQFFRMLGIELSNAEYPIVQIAFERSPDAIRSNLSVTVPLGTEIRSSVDASLVAYTTEVAQFYGSDRTISVPARLNRLGSLPNLRVGELSVVPGLISGLSRAYNDGVVINSGKPRETLSEAMIRARDLLQLGDRCVTARDYYRIALDAGATKANVLQGIQIGAPGYFGDLVTVVLYPAATVPSIEPILRDRSLGGRRLDVQGAEVIPVTGVIRPRVLPNLSDREVFNLVAGAIASKVNPPYGTWGDVEFAKTVAIALEQTYGIYAVPEIELYEVASLTPISELEIHPWQLLEIQASTKIEALR